MWEINTRHVRYVEISCRSPCVPLLVRRQTVLSIDSGWHTSGIAVRLALLQYSIVLCLQQFPPIPVEDLNQEHMNSDTVFQ